MRTNIHVEETTNGRPGSRLERRIATAAERGRQAFEYPRRWRFPIRLDGVSLVAILGALTGLVGGAQGAYISGGCGDIPVQIDRVEVTFSASRFARLLGSSPLCAEHVARSFVTWDAI